MGQNLLPSAAVGARDAEDRRQLLPLFEQRRAVAIQVAPQLCGRKLVDLGKDDAERHPFASEQPEEIQVDALGLQSCIDQNVEEVHLLAAKHIVEDESGKFVAHRAGCPRVAVTRQIDQIPAVVDQKVVDEPRFARRAGDFGQPRVAREHVDERRFAHVAAPDEGDVAQRVGGNLRRALGTATELCLVDLHA